jgi:hypothetical protein
LLFAAAPSQADLFQPFNLETLADLDSVVESKYAGLTNQAFVFPPRTMIGTNACFSRIFMWGGWFTFSPQGSVSEVTNHVVPSSHFGFPVWRLRVVAN